MDAYVEPHLSWTLLTRGDLPQLRELRDQIAALDNSVLASLAADIDSREFDIPVGQAVGGRDSYNTLSAYGVNYIAGSNPTRAYLMGGVHPTHRHLSIGTSLLHWQVTSAIRWRDEHRPGEPLWLGCYAEVGHSGLEEVASSLGFEPTRFYYDLARDLTQPISLPKARGVTIVGFVPANSEAVRRLHNLCFSSIGADEVDVKAWTDRLAEDTFRPGWSVLAMADDQVVGYAMSGVDESVDNDDGALYGWTERFGVHPDYRGRGVALAMLASCLIAMKADGCVEAGIGIDTENQFGVRRLAAELGFATRDAVALLTKVVP